MINYCDFHWKHIERFIGFFKLFCSCFQFYYSYFLMIDYSDFYFCSQLHLYIFENWNLKKLRNNPVTNLILYKTFPSEITEKSDKKWRHHTKTHHTQWLKNKNDFGKIGWDQKNFTDGLWKFWSHNSYLIVRIISIYGLRKARYRLWLWNVILIRQTSLGLHRTKKYCIDVTESIV